MMLLGLLEWETGGSQGRNLQAGLAGGDNSRRWSPATLLRTVLRLVGILMRRHQAELGECQNMSDTWQRTVGGGTYIATSQRSIWSWAHCKPPNNTEGHWIKLQAFLTHCLQKHYPFLGSELTMGKPSLWSVHPQRSMTLGREENLC